MNKKAIAIIVGIIIVSICATVGIVYASNSLISEEKLADLTEEDKVVKKEIAKYSDTKIDFRKNMQEEILGKKHEIEFVEINKYNTEKVVCKNDLGDEFEYNIETGKLCEAIIKSNVVKETDNSIDIDEAYKIAMKLLPDDVNLNEYTKDSYCQTGNGFYFRYVRCFGKYASTDSFSAIISFEGSVVSLNDNTDEFRGKDIDFSERYITEKIDEFAKENNAVNIRYDYATVLVEKGKLCVDISYDIEYKDGTTGRCATPIELE